jgi:hypothetical protein
MRCAFKIAAALLALGAVMGPAAAPCSAGGYYYVARSYYVVPPPVYAAPVIAPAPLFLHEPAPAVFLAPRPAPGYFFPMPSVSTRVRRGPFHARYTYEVEYPGGTEYKFEYRRGLTGSRWRVRIDD